MKQYLLDSFLFNDAANKKMLSKMKSLPDKEHCIKYFSHLINSQYKWMARIVQNPKAAGMSWWEPIYHLGELNYHSIHHRAQMQTIIREQNIEPDFIDYIGTKYRKLS